MDKLPGSLLLEILSRLDDSADVACCRVASKAFDDVSPFLRSINIGCSSKWFWDSSSPFKRIFLDLISKQETVESVSISRYSGYLYDVDFAKEWLPRVSKSLKSLSLSSHNLVNLKLRSARLSMHNLNPLPMLTSLTLEYTELEDEQLNGFNKCFPNLQHLYLIAVVGHQNPKIHHLNLQACHLDFYRYPPPHLTQNRKCLSCRHSC
ncbi:hypothetical protein M8C21_014138 [Ambrosia artemisiifolia]|uniref:Uncharacterized protein n=1 Tax=Ambrosia artemisiifolia TaxID=4212 RepID=A0AAD5GKJ5_AMBAR|nr:hypothetical protein M8C21_014138 [Ambrosia artemisiifolia]